jgi:UDP-GlcNAc3NAcA epimerase
MKILTIIGARPQFIKAATVSRILATHRDTREFIVHTGQHFDRNMSEIFFEELEIPEPDCNLGIHGGLHGEMTGRMLEAIESVLLDERPDCLVVYGDTNSTLAGALAGAKLNIPVAHIEAGLRSFNRAMPEEVNRVLTDHVSTLLLTPTDTATQNLQREGISESKICQVGDVMYDATLFYASKAEQSSTILEELEIESTAFVLATIHRQENTDVPSRLRAIIEGLEELAQEMPVIVPLHPRTRQLLDSAASTPRISRISIIDPVGYLDMVTLERSAAVIATDSGGVQKEAYFHRVPCVTLRDETEWVELVELGWNRLAPPDETDVASVIREAKGRLGQPGHPYGNGHAAESIVDLLLNM